MTNEEYEAIMSKGYKDVLADYENGIVRGWMFLATLYDYAKAKGKIKDVTEPEIDQRIKEIDFLIRRRKEGISLVTEPEIDQRIKEIDFLIRRRKEGISLDPLTRKNMGGDTTPDDIKKKGALVTFFV